MTERDPEIAAMEAIVEALTGLDDQSRDRVLLYVSQRLDIPDPGSKQAERDAPPLVADVPPVVASVSPVRDVRTLKDEKQPSSAIEMAAVVAYYLGELAGPGEQKDELTTTDIEKYFKQAGYPLPQEPRYTLGNAEKAGYFDRTGGGKFKLNPVGHNLVAHGMPSDSSRGGGERKRRKAAGGAKRTSAKKSGAKRTSAKKSGAKRTSAKKGSRPKAGRARKKS
jgi:hypothetical protein